MGAPQSRLFETAKGLQNRGWEVKVITALPNYPTGKIFPEYRRKSHVRENINGIEVRRYWLYPSNSARPLPRIISMVSFSLMVLSAAFYLRKLRPDYIFVESPPLVLGLSGWLLSKTSGSRLILNISDLWPLSAAELGALKKNSYSYKILEGLEKFLYKKAYACTGQSHEIIQHLKAFGTKRAWLYRNGVDPDRFIPPTDNQFEKPLKIVYAGLLGVAQGILELCKKLQFQQGIIELHIYGNGAERGDIEKWLLSHPHSGVVLHESVPRDKIPAILQQYDLTLIPLVKSIYGAVPSKIYEAMAAGLPIIFCGGGEGAEIIKKYDLGWVCQPSDYCSIQSIISYLTKLPNQDLVKKKENCIRVANDIFDRDIQVELLDKNLINGIR